MCCSVFQNEKASLYGLKTLVSFLQIDTKAIFLRANGTCRQHRAQAKFLDVLIEFIEDFLKVLWFSLRKEVNQNCV
ncbi:hypothetical protein SAMN05216302_101241 [Nitrosomonas aestuarii]|uniref:Uncharacterized protein n=1 Tax=Nitrosomonas aestuarii TaxID=52441 RepID=A0A1I4BHN9_9PROT|nr:hypothetical protein SAMN05216302_101241 [Nitrosomonas aestuarii]